MTNSKFMLEREINDISRYLDAVSKDEHLFDKGFIRHKKSRLEELKKELSQYIKEKQ